MTKTAATLLSLALVASCAPPAEETPHAADAPTFDQTSLPTILHDSSRIAMEALPAGKLTRRGACLYLEHAPGRLALILWGDENVRVAGLDTGGWLVNNYTTGQRFREGDTIRGGGGFYPEDADLAAVVQPDPPAGCSGPAVQMYDVRRFDPSQPGGIPAPPPPPPPPSPLLDEAYRADAAQFAGPRRTIPAVRDPLEAMFIYVLQDYAGWQGVHKCASTDDEALRKRLAARMGTVYPAAACGWKDGGAILDQNGEKATFINAQVDCSRQQRVGFCAGMGGAAYGNLGAEHAAYRLRSKGDGWEVEKLGIGVIS